MSLEMMVWALKKDLKNSEFRILLNIANEADSSGICFTGQKKLSAKSGLSIRTVKASISELRKKDLLHTERRPAEFARGRNVDAIILHPGITHWDIPQTEDLEEIEYSRQLRKQYEYIEKEDIQDPEFQGAKSAPRYVSPSQTQGAKYAPSEAQTTFKVQKMDVQGANLSTKTEGALKGTRARLTLNNPVINQSITQSANTSTDAREETPVTDGLMTDSKDLQGDICGVPAKIFITQLRTGLSRYNAMNTSQFAATELLQVVEEILNRTDRTKVTNPVGFCVRVIGNEPGGIPAILELIESKSRYQHNLAIEEHARRLEEQEAKTTLTCPRCDIQYPATGECNSCAADRKALQTPEPPTETIYGPDGKPLRGLDLIHAMRKAQNPSALNRQPVSH